jgi:hypothetical protein
VKKELAVPFLPGITGIGGLIVYGKRKYESGVLSIKKKDFGTGISTS